MNKIKCLICDYECNKNYLGTHLNNTHNISLQSYYDKFIKSEEEGICILCKKQTKFRGLFNGYNPTCSRKCGYKLREQVLQSKFGVSNPFQLQEIKQKSKETLLEKYGTDNISKTEYAKNKKIQTCLKNHGVEYPSCSKEVLEKAVANNIKKYGVGNVMHVESIAQKAALNGGGKAIAEKYTTKFGDEILVQGTYEKKFVDYCEKNNYRVLNGPTILYEFEGKERKYRVDFQVFKDNQKILVEIKSSYWYDRYKEQVEAKKDYTLQYCSKNNLSYQLLIEKWELE